MNKKYTYHIQRNEGSTLFPIWQTYNIEPIQADRPFRALVKFKALYGYTDYLLRAVLVKPPSLTDQLKEMET